MVRIRIRNGSADEEEIERIESKLDAAEIRHYLVEGDILVNNEDADRTFDILDTNDIEYEEQ